MIFNGLIKKNGSVLKSIKFDPHPTPHSLSAFVTHNSYLPRAGFAWKADGKGAWKKEFIPTVHSRAQQSSKGDRAKRKRTGSNTLMKDPYPSPSRP